MFNFLNFFALSILFVPIFLGVTSYFSDIIFIIIFGAVLIIFLINYKYNRNMESDIEEKIDSAIFACCMIFFYALVNGFLGTDKVAIFNNPKFDSVFRYLIIFVCIFLSCSLLKKYRPPMKDATKGWMVFYKFILSQLDIEKAFRRNK